MKLAIKCGALLVVLAIALSMWLISSPSSLHTTKLGSLLIERNFFQFLTDKPKLSPALSSVVNNVNNSSYSYEWLVQESRKMDQVVSDPKEIAEYLRKISLSLTAVQMKELTAIVLDRNATENQRNLALYLLKENKSTPIELYENIAMLPPDRMENHHDIPLNASLSFGALEEIHIKALEDSKLTQSLIFIFREAKSEAVRKLAYELILANNNKKRIYIGVN